MTKKIIPLLLASLLCTNVHAGANCILRSSSATTVVGKIDAISDTRYIASATLDNERKCAISTRVLYHGQWETVYGDYTGDPAIGDQELCLNAVELGVRQFLATKEVKMLRSDQQMVCSDEEPIKIRPVQLGEVIRQSEVQPDPDNTFLFTHAGATCRKFIEPGARTGHEGIYLWHGVICKLGRKDADEWTVQDLY